MTAFPNFCAARPAERRHDRDVRSVSAVSSRAPAMGNCTNDTISPGAERTRRHCYLRKVGLRSIPVQLHEHEISALVACGLLEVVPSLPPSATLARR